MDGVEGVLCFQHAILIVNVLLFGTRKDNTRRRLPDRVDFGPLPIVLVRELSPLRSL